jgi:Ion channel
VSGSTDLEPQTHIKPSRQREGLRRYSAAHFLVALILLLVTMPFVDQLQKGRLIETVLSTLVLLSAVAVVGGRRRTLMIALLLLVPPLLGRWLDHFYVGPTPRTFTALSVAVFLIFIMVHLFRFILHAPHVNSEVVCAGVAGYLLLGILWAMGFLVVSRLHPGSYKFSSGAEGETMDGFNAIYLSFGSLSTLGFGEVVPISRPARMLAVFEALTGMFYMATLISRLVALYSRKPAQ